MLYRENPIFGRKIFFCNPSLFVENTIVEALRQNDFEVYIINNYNYAKTLLMQFPDAMCYFDIDTELSFSGWFNFIKSFSDKSLNTIYLGIISETAKKEDMEKFLMNLKLPGGFINISTRTEKLIKQFIEILELNGAKGRRKYIRLDTTNSDDVKGYVSYSNKLYDLKIKDISVAGFACTYKEELSSIFVKNLHLKNVCISLGRKSIVLASIIFNTFSNKDGTATSVMMFTNENDQSILNDIRNYITSNYLSKVDELVRIITPDYTDYESENVYNDLKTDRSYVEDEEEAAILEELEDLTDLDLSDPESKSDNKDNNTDDNTDDSLYVPSGN
ncbi:MAG: hypothetical protein K6C97_09425 [Treponema sp.]|nr:hypothetical protein [Treponema sp.]